MTCTVSVFDTSARDNFLGYLVATCVLGMALLITPIQARSDSHDASAGKGQGTNLSQACPMGKVKNFANVARLAETPAKTPVAATFAKPVLPGGQRIRLGVDIPYSNWNASRVCGFILIPDAEGNFPNIEECSAKSCRPIDGILVSGDAGDNTKTFLRFVLPPVIQGDGQVPLRQMVRIRIIAIHAYSGPT